MNTFFSFDAATAWHVMGFAVDLMIKATVVLVGALAVTWGARRRSAALRHRVWFLTYCGLLLLPVLPLAVPKWQIPLPSAFDRFQPDVSHSLPVPSPRTPASETANQTPPGAPLDPTFVASSRMDDLSGPTDAAPLREAERGRSPETIGPRSTSITTAPFATAPRLAAAVPQPKRPSGSAAGLFLGALAAVWAAGVAVSLFGIVAGRRRGRQLLKSAEPVRDPQWLEPLEQLCKDLQVTSRVRLLESARAVVPMATGVVRHAVLLPRETEEWPAALRRHVLIHELAHVKRRDVLQHLICRLALAVYWFHPLAWYGVRRMRLEREIACDDFVLMAGEHPCDYAAELVGIARQLRGMATPWVVCMASGSTLEERVRAMLDRARSHGPLSVAAARSLLIVALAAIALLAAVEPGTSSVRKPASTSAANVNEQAPAGPSAVKDRAPLVDRTAGNTILAQAHDKQPAAPVSTAPDSKDPTYSFAGTIVDQQGRPVPNARISLNYFQAKPAAFDLPAAVSDVQGRFTITGYFPTETVHLEVFDVGRNLVGTSELTGPPPATLTITLSPGASIAGRVLDEESLPIPYAPVVCDSRHATADAQGRFELKGLLPGSKCSAWTALMRGPGNRRQRELFDLFTDVTAQKGETKQLGDLRLKPRRRAAKKRSGAAKGPKNATSKTSQQAPRDAKPAEPATDNSRLRLAIRVLDPNGKPVVGASVAIHAILDRNFSGTGFDTVSLGAVSTDVMGRFEYSIDRSLFPASKGVWSKTAMFGYVATKPGFGLAVGSYSERSKAPPADLTLVPDEPVHGRVLNLEGRPVSGARIDVNRLFMNTEYLTQLKQMETAGISQPFQVRGMVKAPISPAMLPTATTDADGRFEIRGLGRDRMVVLRIAGPQIAVSPVQVVTRPMQKTEIRLRLPGGGPTWNAPNVFYGSQFEFVAEPSVPVEGTVKDEDTGAPIAGVIVASDWLRVPMSVSPHGLISTVSDAQGRFKLEGFPLDDVNRLQVFPLDLPYLSADDLGVPRGKPPQPITRDIKLRRGVWAVGRVQDVKTGKPVEGTLLYTPFRSNEFAKRYGRYQSRIRTAFGTHPAGETDGEGRFRILVIPGRGLVCFRSLRGHYIGGNGAAGIPELAKDKPRRKGEGPTFDSVVPTWFEAVHEINPAADAKTVEVNLSVDPGQDVTLRFVDRSGKPLSGPLRAGGMHATSSLGGNDTDKVVVWALSQGETRIVWIKHKASGLSKYVHFTAKPGESERTITLEPPAVLTGRLVSTDGKPYAGWSVDCQYSLGYNSMSAFPPARTDSQGRFRFEIPGGGPFDVVSRSGPLLDIARNLTVQSGEQIDFGELVVNDRDSLIDFKKKMVPKRTLSPAADPQMGNRPRP